MCIYKIVKKILNNTAKRFIKNDVNDVCLIISNIHDNEWREHEIFMQRSHVVVINMTVLPYPAQEVASPEMVRVHTTAPQAKKRLVPLLWLIFIRVFKNIIFTLNIIRILFQFF